MDYRYHRIPTVVRESPMLCTVTSNDDACVKESCIRVTDDSFRVDFTMRDILSFGIFYNQEPISSNE